MLTSEINYPFILHNESYMSVSKSTNVILNVFIFQKKVQFYSCQPPLYHWQKCVLKVLTAQGNQQLHSAVKYYTGDRGVSLHLLGRYGRRIQFQIPEDSRI